MRKTLLPVFLLFTSLSFAQTPYVLHLDDVTQVTQYDLEHAGADRIHAGTAIIDQQQTIVWFAKTSASNELLWMKSFPMAINNPGSTGFMDLNDIVDIGTCHQSDDIMLSVKRIDTVTFNMYIEVLKLSANGDVIWGRRITFPEQENSFHVLQSNRMIVLDNDAVVVSNGHKNGLSLCKLSSQGARLASHHFSTSQEVIEDFGNGGWALTTAIDGGFFASFQVNSHPVLAKLDQQFNVVFARQWSSLEKAITAIRDFGNDVMFGGLGVGGDFYGIQSDDLGATSFADISNGGYSGFYDFDFSTVSSLPGRFFAQTSHGYKLIDYATNTYTFHQLSNGFSDFGTHVRLGEENTPGSSYLKATYFTRCSSPSSVPYMEELDIATPQCINDASAEHPMIPIEIPANTVSNPTIFKLDYGSFSSYEPTITARSGFISENCFYVGTAENTLPAFEIFPNPVASEQVLHIESPGIESGVIILTDLHGKTVAEFAYAAEITLPALNAGVYFVTVSEQNGQHSSTQRIVIQ